MMTTMLDHRRAENAPGDLGKALALLIAWGREECEQQATQDAQDLADDAPQPETPGNGQ
jgi:hypothetical protein